MYKLTLIHTSAHDQTPVNDTLRFTYERVAPLPQTGVYNFNTFYENFNLPPGWYGRTEGFLRAGNALYFSEGGPANYTRRYTAFSPGFTGITIPSPHLVLDMRFIASNTTINQGIMRQGDTIRFYGIKDCGAEVLLRTFLPGTNIGNVYGMQQISLAPLAPIAPENVIAFKLVVSHDFALNSGKQIFMDNWRIATAFAIDAGVDAAVRYPFSKLPVRHIRPFTPAVRVKNMGYNSIQLVNAVARITPLGYQQFSSTSVMPPQGTNSVQTLVFPPATPLIAGPYTLTYNLSMGANQTDENLSNNSDTVNFFIGDTTMSRHYGERTHNLGYSLTPANGQYIIGQTIDIIETDTLTGLSFYLDSTVANLRVKPVLYLCNAATGRPNSLPLDTLWPNQNYTAAQAGQWHYITLRRGSDKEGVILEPGKYFIGLMQKQGRLMVGANRNRAERFSLWQRNSLAGGLPAWVEPDTTAQLLMEYHFGGKWKPTGPAIDAGVDAAVRYPFSKLPVRHIKPFTPAVRVKNMGYSSIQQVNAVVRINPLGYQHFSSTSVMPPQGTNSVQTLVFPPATPLIVGPYTLTYNLSMGANQTDENLSNNSDSVSFFIGDTTIARHYGERTHKLGYSLTPANGQYIIGQTIDIIETDTLTGMSFYLDSTAANLRVKPLIYGCDANTGRPNSTPLDTLWPNQFYTAAHANKWHYIALRRWQNAGLALPPGKYFIGLMQKQGRLMVGANRNRAERFSLWQRNSLTGGIQAWVEPDTTAQLLMEYHFGGKWITGHSASSVQTPIIAYPNPTSGQLFFSGLQGMTTVHLYDLSGKLMLTQCIAPTEAVQLKALPRGMYLWKINDKVGRVVRE
jgi:hypothetical protein